MVPRPGQVVVSQQPAETEEYPSPLVKHRILAILWQCIHRHMVRGCRHPQLPRALNLFLEASGAQLAPLQNVFEFGSGLKQPS